MTIKVLSTHNTVSRNVFLVDTGIETYNGVDVRDGGVMFDMFLVCGVLDSSPIVNLTRRGIDFYACFKVLQKNSVTDLMDDVLEIVCRHKEQVTFRHLEYPSHFDSALSTDWGALALDVLESYLVEGEPMARRSRYLRKPVI